MSSTLTRLFPALALLMVFSAGPGFAQSGDESNALRKDMEALKEGQKALQKDLQDIKELLRARPAAAPPAAAAQPLENVVLSIEGAPSLGDKDAKVTLLEFSDYQCPFCARHVKQTMPEILKEYVNTGKVRYVLRDFPIESLHPKAFKAHEAAHCAGEQGKYWEMHERIFENQRTLDTKDFVGHAQALGLDVAKFEQCVGGGKYAEKIRQNMAAGQQAGVSGTPTFFVGIADAKDSKITARRLIRGAQPYQGFKQAIDSVLAEQKQGG
jgi:protein-disulfide isomerase